MDDETIRAIEERHKRYGYCDEADVTLLLTEVKRLRAEVERLKPAHMAMNRITAALIRDTWHRVAHDTKP